MTNPVKSPFEILVDYERGSQAHPDAQAIAAQAAVAANLWRGVGFRVGDRKLVSSLTEVAEILSFPEITRVPGACDWLLGVASVRGNLIPLIDLKGFVTGEATHVCDASRVILVRQGGGSVGLLVDEVVGQRNFSAEHRSSATREPDGFARYVVERYAHGDVQWEQFSMAALVRAGEFSQAAA